LHWLIATPLPSVGQPQAGFGFEARDLLAPPNYCLAVPKDFRELQKIGLPDYFHYWVRLIQQTAS
jgi:hypothetical protein